MTDYLNIGSTPPAEACLGVGHPLQRAECAVYRRQLLREFPHGDFRIKSFNHDFGTYFEVVAWYDEALPEDEQARAAWDAESSCADFWDEQAKRELTQAGIKDQE